MQRSGAVAEEPAGQRRAARGDGEAARQVVDHLSHVAFGGGDGAAAQRTAERQLDGRPGCQVQDVDPVLGEFAAPGRRDDLPGADGQGSARLWRASSVSWRSRDGASRRAAKRSHDCQRSGGESYGADRSSTSGFMFQPSAST